MIKVFTEGHDYHYEITDILTSYGEKGEIQFVKEETSAKDCNIFVHSVLRVCTDGVFVKCSITGNGRTKKNTNRFELCTGNDEEIRKQYKRYVKHNMLVAAEDFYGKPLPWGILTGIRPVKMIHMLMNRGLEEDRVYDVLVHFYKLAPDRARLGIEIALYERRFVFPYDPKKVSVYISIPFCPTRCSYCSFPSYEIKRWGHLSDRYIEVLTEEIRVAGGALARNRFDCDTVYIGGGTPTSLGRDQLRRLLDGVAENIPGMQRREYTFEAGRPDTLDFAKLKLLKEYGVTRISINPQTMNAATLDIIGRKHSPGDIISAFETAREAGHNNINMDIILGLPGEKEEMVAHTLNEIGNLGPEGITVHTLAIKRASKLHEEVSDSDWIEEEEVMNMMGFVTHVLRDMRMRPYYLYRQKYMVGNLENIGFCLPGCEGIYNMQIMEEKQTIIGLGAGAVTKIVHIAEDRLKRKQNPKSLEHYLSRAESIASGWDETISSFDGK